MNSQRGAALVTSLVLLLVLTVIGVSAMQMTRMQERMAGNTRDIDLALQGAEAALRDGESRIDAFDSPPYSCSSAPCEVFQFDVLPSVHDADETWWDVNAREYGAPEIPELAREGGGDLTEEPQFVIEEIGFDGDGILYNPTGREFYQVSARSTGGSGDANVVVQSTYARQY